MIQCTTVMFVKRTTTNNNVLKRKCSNKKILQNKAFTNPELILRPRMLCSTIFEATTTATVLLKLYNFINYFENVKNYEIGFFNVVHRKTRLSGLSYKTIFEKIIMID